ncbi:hypothetical protein MAP44135_4541 [Mycobacterium avium subsp. paratuberculosis]|nr:hypothetical protein MAP44135_4541 [Mycobacterium avium subsp. paratuberculosis]
MTPTISSVSRLSPTWTTIFATSGCRRCARPPTGCRRPTPWWSTGWPPRPRRGSSSPVISGRDWSRCRPPGRWLPRPCRRWMPRPRCRMPRRRCRPPCPNPLLPQRFPRPSHPPRPPQPRTGAPRSATPPGCPRVTSVGSPGVGWAADSEVGSAGVGVCSGWPERSSTRWVVCSGRWATAWTERTRSATRIPWTTTLFTAILFTPMTPPTPRTPGMTLTRRPPTNPPRRIAPRPPARPNRTASPLRAARPRPPVSRPNPSRPHRPAAPRRTGAPPAERRRPAGPGAAQPAPEPGSTPCQIAADQLPQAGQ